MGASRVWAWDLEEMKSAGAMSAQPNEDVPSPMPIIPGFTPINPPQLNVNDGLTPQDTIETAHTAGKNVKTPKRRKTNPYAPKSAAQTRKPAASKKPRRAKIAGELHCHDISNALARTKPAVSGYGKLASKRVATTKSVVHDETPETGLAVGTFNGPWDIHGSTLSDRQTTPPALGDQYQAAYVKGQSSCFSPSGSIAGGTASSPPTVAPDDVARCEINTHSCEPVAGTKPIIQADPWSDDGDMFLDYMVPPSAQNDKTLQDIEGLRKQETASDRAPRRQHEHVWFDSDGIFEDQGNQGDLVSDNDNFYDTVQSIAPHAPAERDPLDNWSPNQMNDQSSMEDVDTAMDVPILPPALPPSENVRAVTRKSVNLEEESTSSPSPEAKYSRVAVHTFGNSVSSYPRTSESPKGSEYCFDDDDLDEDLAHFAADSSDVLQLSMPLTSPLKPTTPKLQWMPPKVYTPAKSSHVPVSILDVPHLVPVNAQGEALPFTRPPFPKPIRDRSPILGLSNRTVLRTCFRIGEALNAAAIASRSNTDAIIELYARIVSSEREDEGGFKQFFQFGDLFTDKPPYLTAIYSLWKGVGMWNLDSKVFLGEEGRGKMARIMGRTIRRDSESGCEMTIMSIWEVDWEDVGIAKGIVCS